MKKTLLLIAGILIFLAPLAAAAINIHKPSSAECWCLGGKPEVHPYSTSQIIEWATQGPVPNNFYIHLIKAGALESAPPALVIADNFSPPLSSIYQFPWTIPCSIDPGQYRIKVGTVNPAISDQSKVFKIISCPLFVYSPPFYGACRLNSPQKIEWKTSNCFTGTVRLILLQNGKYMGVIASGLPSTKKSFYWKAGQTDKGSLSGSGFRVRVIRESGPREQLPTIKAPPMADSEEFSILAIPHPEQTTPATKK